MIRGNDAVLGYAPWVANVGRLGFTRNVRSICNRQLSAYGNLEWHRIVVFSGNPSKLRFQIGATLAVVIIWGASCLKALPQGLQGLVAKSKPHARAIACPRGSLQGPRGPLQCQSTLEVCRKALVAQHGVDSPVCCFSHLRNACLTAAGPALRHSSASMSKPRKGTTVISISSSRCTLSGIQSFEKAAVFAYMRYMRICGIAAVFAYMRYRALGSTKHFSISPSPSVEL